MCMEQNLCEHLLAPDNSITSGSKLMCPEFLKECSKGQSKSSPPKLKPYNGGNKE